MGGWRGLNPHLSSSRPDALPFKLQLPFFPQKNLSLFNHYISVMIKERKVLESLNLSVKKGPSAVPSLFLVSDDTRLFGSAPLGSDTDCLFNGLTSVEYLAPSFRVVTSVQSLFFIKL